MRTLTLLALMTLPGITSADWGIDFYRYQCVPELGRLYLDTFYIDNPDDYGKISYLGSNKAVFAALAKEYGIYAVEGKGKEFECLLGGEPLRIVLTFGSNSQGQSTGQVTVKSGKEELVVGLSLFAYYGHSPLVNRFEIVSGGRSSGLFASFEVTGAQGHPNFTFNRALTAGKPITNASVQDEAKIHP